jgi:hypothetical protein
MPPARPAATLLFDHLAALDDPRQQAKVPHPPRRSCRSRSAPPWPGSTIWSRPNSWGGKHVAFLRRFLPYRHGVPSQDTLDAVLAALDPGLFCAGRGPRARAASPAT